MQRVVAPLLFCSGFCALIYQTAWMRQFRLIFGASTLATAAVLAIFMGGLGLGSALLGRRADAHPRPLRLYGTLELLIAVSAALSPLLLWIAGKVYVALGGSVSMGLVLATIVRLLLAALVLAAPTLLMGGTLPAAARAVETSDDAGRRKLALLYGVNTLGAVTGTVVSTFFMLERFGNRRTLLLAVALNVIVGVVAIAIGGSERADVPREETEAARPRIASPFVFAAAAIVGFAFLLMELVWYRMLGPLLGGSTFTFGLILAVALLGIALGGAAYSLWSGNRGATAGGFALTCTLEAAAVLLPFALGDRLAVLAEFLRTAGNSGFGGYVFGWTIVTSIVVLPAAFVSGVQFPLLIALLGRGGDDVGQHVGRAYAWNTLGAIAGSLAGGFGFLPLFTATGCWKLAALLLGLTGLAAAAFAMRDKQHVAAIASTVAAMLAVVFATALGPTPAWRHSGIGAGRSESPDSPNAIRQWQRTWRRMTVWEADGRESAVALVDDDDFAFIVNGKSDGSAHGDAATQVMGGLVGAMLHDDPRSALVVGLGTGSTAGWLGAVPSMQRVDVVELEPSILRVARDCTTANHDVLHNPKVRIRIADAREVLLTAPARYDIIFSEPSNPYRAGIASLFTREFYEAAAARLQRGGVFLQWVQSYDIDTETVRTIYATIGAVFPHVDTWRTGEGDLLLVATREPLTVDLARLRARVALEPYRSAMHATWRVESVEGFLSHFIAGDAVTRAAARGAELNTDDRTPIEFGLARSLGEGGRFQMDEIIRLAFALGAQRPAALRGPIDWQQVLLQRATQTDIEPVAGVASPAEQAHHAFSVLWQREDLRGALASWDVSGRWQPVNSEETAKLAESLAEFGRPEAMTYAEALRRWEPIEADVIEASLLQRAGNTRGAAALFQRAFVAYRQTPWPLQPITNRALQHLGQLVARDHTTFDAIDEAISRPFAAGQWEQYRRRQRFELARTVDPCGTRAVAALRSVEPWAPWEEPILKARAACYAKAGLRELAQTARNELAEFEASEPKPLAR